RCRTSTGISCRGWPTIPSRAGPCGGLPTSRRSSPGTRWRGASGRSAPPLPRPTMADSAAAKKTRARKILGRLAKAYPKAGIELDFTTPLELLAATILSAQCTDERVNEVTRTLFTRYRTAEDYARARPATLEREIHSTGFFKAKARSLMGMGQALVERHGGAVPRTPEGLVALPRVGRKTANLRLGTPLDTPPLAADTQAT